MMELIFTKGPKAGERFAVEADRVTIGRLGGCDLELNYPNVSRKHAFIKRAGERVFLVDNRSGNGTFVNGRRIARVDLRAGDEVRIGGHTMRVEVRASKAWPAERPTRRDLLTRFFIKDQTDGLRELEFAGESLTIGRGEQCQLVLDDDEVSRRQARIIHRQGCFELKDAGSANGTRLNGRPAREAELRSGDLIEMGGMAIAVLMVADTLHLTVTRRPAAQTITKSPAPEPQPAVTPLPQAHPSSAQSQAASVRSGQGRMRYPIISGLALALAMALLLILVGRAHAATRGPPGDRAHPVVLTPREGGFTLATGFRRFTSRRRAHVTTDR